MRAKWMGVAVAAVVAFGLSMAGPGAASAATVSISAAGSDFVDAGVGFSATANTNGTGSFSEYYDNNDISYYGPNAEYIYSVSGSGTSVIQSSYAGDRLNELSATVSSVNATIDITYTDRDNPSNDYSDHYVGAAELSFSIQNLGGSQSFEFYLAGFELPYAVNGFADSAMINVDQGLEEVPLPRSIYLFGAALAFLVGLSCWRNNSVPRANAAA